MSKAWHELSDMLGKQPENVALFASLRQFQNQLPDFLRTVRI